jgi:hypothetical protein
MTQISHGIIYISRDESSGSMQEETLKSSEFPIIYLNIKLENSNWSPQNNTDNETNKLKSLILSGDIEDQSDFRQKSGQKSGNVLLLYVTNYYTLQYEIN